MSRKSWIELGALLLVVWLGSQWWISHNQAALGGRMAALAQPGDVQMISSVTCPLCAVARTWLLNNEVAHQECFIERDAVCRQRFESLLAPGTPVFLVRGQMQLGFSPERILLRLQKES